MNDLNQWGTFNLSPRIVLHQPLFQAAIGLIETDYMTEIMATVDMLKKAMVKEVKPNVMATRPVQTQRKVKKR